MGFFNNVGATVLTYSEYSNFANINRLNTPFNVNDIIVIEKNPFTWGSKSESESIGFKVMALENKYDHKCNECIFGKTSDEDKWLCLNAPCRIRRPGTPDVEAYFQKL